LPGGVWRFLLGRACLPPVRTGGGAPRHPPPQPPPPPPPHPPPYQPTHSPSNNWFHYVMLAWLPTYFVDTLSVDLMHAAQTALLPPLAGIAASAAAGSASDALLARGAPLPAVRKGMQCLAFLAPTACLLGAATLGDRLPPSASVGLITVALGVSSFSLAGLYCTHQDLSPKYSSALLGLTNTAGAIPGIVGVAATGLLYDRTGSWAAALFLPTAFFLTTGAVVYTLLGSNAQEDFDADGADDPFEWEAAARALLPWAATNGSGGGGDASGSKGGKAE
jgi:ACS family sodium-dependent inorganic phosphate cotransporter